MEPFNWIYCIRSHYMHYLCIYIYIHTYIHIVVYNTYIHIYIYIYTVYNYVYIYKLYTYIHIYICIYTHIHTYIYMYIYITIVSLYMYIHILHECIWIPVQHDAIETCRPRHNGNVACIVRLPDRLWQGMELLASSITGTETPIDVYIDRDMNRYE